MILEHKVERCTLGDTQCCIRCGEVIADSGLFPFPTGHVYHVEGVGFWCTDIDPAYQHEVRPCRLN